jgi:hypothetical protein
MEPRNRGLPENRCKLYVAAAAEAACSKTFTARPRLSQLTRSGRGGLT